MSDTNLVNQVRKLIDSGIYDPNELFKRVYFTNRVHYSKVREAIDRAKNF
jgi:hypothetical protein